MLIVPRKWTGGVWKSRKEMAAGSNQRLQIAKKVPDFRDAEMLEDVERDHQVERIRKLVQVTAEMRVQDTYSGVTSTSDQFRLDLGSEDVCSFRPSPSQ